MIFLSFFVGKNINDLESSQSKPGSFYNLQTFHAVHFASQGQTRKPFNPQKRYSRFQLELQFENPALKKTVGVIYINVYTSKFP